MMKAENIVVEELNTSTLDGAIATIRSLPSYFYERDLRKAEKSYEAYVSGQLKESIFLVAKEAEKVVGVVGAVKRGDANEVYYLASFAVHEGTRGKGIGRKILKTLEDHLRSQKVRMLYTETTTASYCDETRAFYEAMGYEMVAEVADYWDINDPLALYEKRL
ncbi:MAG: GNAT family N-acetyltransferase, partial [Firmicutes bacterium]|nr:GNAT family N-acetyltransferase [Bacillota bacterium]